MTPYDKATKKLEQQVNKLVLPAEFVPKYDMASMVHMFRTTFKIPSLRATVLSRSLEAERVANQNFSAGFCGIASYTWNHLFRMPDGSEIWRLKMVSKDKYNPYSHVWLESKITGEPLDLTFDQFYDEAGNVLEFPYSTVGKYVNSDFELRRAYKFGEYMGIDLELVVFENSLRNLGRR